MTNLHSVLDHSPTVRFHHTVKEYSRLYCVGLCKYTLLCLCKGETIQDAFLRAHTVTMEMIPGRDYFCPKASWKTQQ